VNWRRKHFTLAKRSIDSEFYLPNALSPSPKRLSRHRSFPPATVVFRIETLFHNIPVAAREAVVGRLEND